MQKGSATRRVDPPVLHDHHAGATLAESAELLTAVTGRSVRYRPESIDEARASQSGAQAWEIEGWITSYAAIATGELDVVSDTVPRLTGHRARSAREFLAG